MHAQEGLQYAFWSATSAILEHAALRAEASELGMESWLELRTQVSAARGSKAMLRAGACMLGHAELAGVAHACVRAVRQWSAGKAGCAMLHAEACMLGRAELAGVARACGPCSGGLLPGLLRAKAAQLGHGQGAQADAGGGLQPVMVVLLVLLVPVLLRLEVCSRLSQPA